MAFEIPLVQPLANHEVRLGAPLVRLVADRRTVQHNQRQTDAGRRDQSLPGRHITPRPAAACVELIPCGRATPLRTAQMLCGSSTCSTRVYCFITVTAVGVEAMFGLCPGTVTFL